MENRAPFFLDKLLKRNPQNSASSNENGWGKRTYITVQSGRGLLPGNASYGASSNGWEDELPEKQYNGWGSGSAGKRTGQQESFSGWADEPPKDEFNGWGLAGKHTTCEANSNGWMDDHESTKGLYNGLSSNDKCIASTASRSGWMDEPPKDEQNRLDVSKWNPVDNTFQQREDDFNLYPVVESRPVEVESPAPPPVPSAPPLPEDIYNDDITANILHKSVDSTEEEIITTNGGKDRDASGSSCVVCWEAQIEGACVPCGHMAGCMPCLNEIESNHGTCPVCRAKIDKVMRIYVVSTN